jgi:hypothetical protein
MKKLLMMLIVLTTAAPPVWAQANTQEVDDPGLISPLEKGQQAPFPGVLFSPKAASIIGADISLQKDRVKIEVDAAVKSAEAKKDFAYNELNIACTADKARASASLEANLKRLEVLEKDLQEARKSAPSRAVWFSIGAAAGVVVTGLAAVAIVQVIK